MTVLDLLAVQAEQKAAITIRIKRPGSRRRSGAEHVADVLDAAERMLQLVAVHAKTQKGNTNLSRLDQDVTLRNGMAKRRAVRGDQKRAIGVVRVSTSKQDIGAAAQRSELVRWARSQGVELVAVFEDLGVTGSSPLTKRPGLIAALSALREHGAGLLVAVRRDRFARHRHLIADVEREAHRAGGVLVTTDGICTGEDSEAEEVQASIQDLLASLELRKIKARNKARAQRCIAEGRTHGGKLPFGYQRCEDGVKGRSGVVVELEPHPGEQRIVTKMRNWRDSGLSLRNISDRLKKEGAVNRGGRPFSPMSIKRILDRDGQ